MLVMEGPPCAFCSHVARTLARRNLPLVFACVSGAWSNPDSPVMPLKVKGEAERALAELPIRTVMFHPGPTAIASVLSEGPQNLRRLLRNPAA